jgi:hypothetical protein
MPVLLRNPARGRSGGSPSLLTRQESRCSGNQSARPASGCHREMRMGPKANIGNREIFIVIPIGVRKETQLAAREGRQQTLSRSKSAGK